MPCWCFLIGAGHEAGDGTGDQDAATATLAHVASDFLDEVDRAGDVGVDDLQHLVEVLVEKALAQSASGSAPPSGVEVRT